MALQLGALREALVHAGAKPELAAKAAEELAGYENRLSAIEQRLIELRAYVDRRFTEMVARIEQRFTTIEGRINLLTWMVGSLGTVMLGFLIAVFIKLFVH